MAEAEQRRRARVANGERRAWFDKMGFTTANVITIVTIALGLAGVWYNGKIEDAKRDADSEKRTRAIALEVVTQELRPVNIEIAAVHDELKQLNDRGERFDVKLDRVLEIAARRTAARAVRPEDPSWQ